MRSLPGGSFNENAGVRRRELLVHWTTLPAFLLGFLHVKSPIIPVRPASFYVFNRLRCF